MRRIIASNGSIKIFTPCLAVSYIDFGNINALDFVDHIYALLGLSDVKSLNITETTQQTLKSFAKRSLESIFEEITAWAFWSLRPPVVRMLRENRKRAGLPIYTIIFVNSL
jgi:hypothetical protein